MAIFLPSRDISSLFSMENYIEAVEDAYRQMGQGEISMLPRITLDVKGMPGFLKILPASFSESKVAGVHVYSVSGSENFTKVILLFDITSGNLQAIIESDRIGWLVPGAASAVATKYLASEEAKVMGMFGSGRQARSQLLAISLVRDLELIKVHSPQKNHREEYCKEMKRLYGLNVVPVDSPEEAIQGSHIISTTTNSRIPIFDGNLVDPGTHINAIGAHHPDRRELDSRCIQRSKVVVDSIDRALKEEGELLIPINEGILSSDHIYGELGEIVAGKRQGRTDQGEITLFLSGGIATEYVAVAWRIYRKAREKRVGQDLQLEKDPDTPKSLYLKTGKKSPSNLQ